MANQPQRRPRHACTLNYADSSLIRLCVALTRPEQPPTNRVLFYQPASCRNCPGTCGSECLLEHCFTAAFVLNVVQIALAYGRRGGWSRVFCVRERLAYHKTTAPVLYEVTFLWITNTYVVWNGSILTSFIVATLSFLMSVAPSGSRIEIKYWLVSVVRTASWNSSK